VPINVLIVDDHVMFASCLARVLADEDDMRVVATCADAEGALAAMSDDVDVVLTDFRLTTGDGIQLTRGLVAQRPHLRVVMLTASNDEGVMANALEAGCAGFIIKSDPLELVLSAIRSAAAGESVVSPALLARLLPRLVARPRGRNPDLTVREREILQAMARGGSNQQIADELVLARDTVRNHVASILSKLGVNSKLQAVTLAIQRGLISPEV
jgi:two-component system, NarL family, nitrate/nitrite response regulator NarL